MDLLTAAILGIVEGVTEFLPVSSTGHLILATHLLGVPQSEFIKSFEISIQLGAIAAVLALYGRSVWRDTALLKRVAAAFLPTAVVGFVLYKFIKHALLGNTNVVVAALFLGGLFLIWFDRHYRPSAPPDEEGKGFEKISYRQAIGIGLCQSLAVVPGVSRSAATIVGGLSMGIGRRTIVEFSFLLAVPTMLAATVLDLAKGGLAMSGDQALFLAVGFITAFAVALASLRWLLNYVQSHGFFWFGVYRMAAAFIYWYFV